MSFLKRTFAVGINGLYAILWTLMALMTMLVVWLTLSTELLLRPQAIHYNGRSVTLVRETPFGTVWGQWSTEIQVTRMGLDCNSGRNWAPYQPLDDNTTSYFLGAWAEPCLKVGPPLVIVDTWQAWLWGVIPLRPTSKTSVIELPNAD